jgi:hypothetical protein
MHDSWQMQFCSGPQPMWELMRSWWVLEEERAYAFINRSEWLWLRCPHGVIIAASRLLKQDAPTCDEVSWKPIFPATCVMWGQGQRDTQSQQMQHKGLHRRVMYLCVNYLLNMYAKCGAQRILGECSFKGCPRGCLAGVQRMSTCNVVILRHVKCSQAPLATQLSQHSWGFQPGFITLVSILNVC